MLDIIFGKKPTSRKNRSSKSGNQSTSSKIEHHASYTSVEEAPVQGSDHFTGYEKIKGDKGDYVKGWVDESDRGAGRQRGWTGCYTAREY